MVLIYQWLLVSAFLIGGRIGEWISKGFSKLMKHKPKYFDELSGARCYPYYYIWRNMLTSMFNKKKLYLSSYVPSAPVVYLYGKKTSFKTVGDKWKNYLLEHERCESHGLECEHWIMNT